LKIRAELDRGKYPTGIKITDAELASEGESFSVASGATGEAEVFDDLIGPSMCHALVARNRG